MARGDFEIVDQKPIGRGYSGTVFRARRIADSRAVALKLVLKNEEGGAERIAAERHGAILQQRFAERHGMVPEIYEYGADGDDFYIAMEFVDGRSLEVRLREGPLPARESVGHARWLCDFLEKAHGFSSTVEGKPYRLLHNDLKPAHLMISEAGDRKVLDFGIAKALEEARDLGTDVGRTIAYAAPERLLSGRVNVQADFWSVGVMLYEMVSGHRPYPALEGRRHRSQLEHAITTNTPREPLPNDCPRHLAAIISRLLAFQPEHRYQSPAEIREDLDRFLQDATPEAAAYYDTPATMPVARDSQPATSPTVPATDPGPHAPVAAELKFGPTKAVAAELKFGPTDAATDPLPLATTGVSVASPPAAPAAPARRIRRTIVPRFASAVLSLTFVALVALEGVAWIFAERFRDGIGTIDQRSVTIRRQSYEAVDRWSLLDLGLRVRVNYALANALQAVGDRVVADYRRETPVMGPSEWSQAQEAFAWARRLLRPDRRLTAKQLLAEGHVKRLEAESAASVSGATLAYQDALAKFHEAAAADEESFDPYLGIAVIQVYGLGDVDAAAAAIDKGIDRGFSPTRRETALLGDGHLRRGIGSRRRAQVLTGDLRLKELMKARTDFERCVAFFEQIVEFGLAASNLETCKTQMQGIDRQLATFSDEW
jgi:aminoglycoside phosphotransferase (APT) family kinase protein